MTKIQIIEETVAYYEANPRSILVEEDVCRYLVEETNDKCGFSRCCTDEAVKILHENFETLGVNSIGNVDHYLKEEYKGHDVYFWGAIQLLHDCGEYWDKNTLTEKGKLYVEETKLRYS